MDRGEISGFWYDEKKRKYFKILPNHVAPTRAEYSREGVRKGREREVEVKKDAMLQKLKERTEVRRARILKSYYGATLSREIGLTKYPRATVATIFSRVMEMQYRINPSTESSLVWSLSKGINASSILKDDYSSTVFTGYHINDTAALMAWVNPVDWRRTWRLVSVDRYTEITSLCLTASRTLVKTTMGGPTKGASIAFIRLHDSTEALDGGVSSIIGAQVDFTLDRQPLAAIWDCSPCTHALAPGEVALGTSRGVVFASPHYIQYMDPRAWSVPSPTNASSVLAVSWLSPYLLSAGFRNGQVQVFDKRVEKHVATWQHPSAVARIRPADAHRFVVAGLQDQLHTYDVRYKAPDTLRPYATSTKLRVSSHIPVTPPYISYPSYRNSATLRIGFDVSPQLGIIAASLEGQEIKMLDVWTGKEIVTSWQNSEWNDDKRLKDVVKHLAFFGMEENAEVGRPSSDSGLLVAYEGYFEEWQW